MDKKAYTINDYWVALMALRHNLLNLAVIKLYLDIIEEALRRAIGNHCDN